MLRRRRRGLPLTPKVTSLAVVRGFTSSGRQFVSGEVYDRARLAELLGGDHKVVLLWQQLYFVVPGSPQEPGSIAESVAKAQARLEAETAPPPITPGPPTAEVEVTSAPPSSPPVPARPTAKSDRRPPPRR